MKYFEKVNDLPIMDLSGEYEKLLSRNTIPKDFSAICVNAIPGKEHDMYFGAGSLTHDWDNSFIDSNGNLVVHKRENELLETGFTSISDIFVGTLFEDVLSHLNKKYVLGRVRLMKSMPKTCLSWHVDCTNRLHYPLITNDCCRMVINDEAHHIPKHEWWMTQTKEHKHTAFNGSFEPRIHLVCAIIKEK